MDQIYQTYLNKDVSSLSPIVSHLGRSVRINNQNHVNGVSMYDFRNQLELVVESYDGNTRTYSVRAGITTLPGAVIASFTDNQNETITDNNSGLVWMRCIMSNVSGVPRTGTWCVDTTIGNYPYCNSNTDDCNSGGTYGSFTGGASASTNTAWKACNDANSNPVGGFGGRTNWRVPIPEEFITIIDYYNGGAYSGKPYRTYFPMGSGSGQYNFYHWTSSRFVVGATLAYAIWGTTGTLETQNKNITAAVRCVSSPL